MLFRLRTLRWLVATLLFVATVAAFVDFKEFIPPTWASWLTGINFVPSAVRLLKSLGLIGIAAVATIVLTLLLGRIYCSFICPLGIFQDIVSRLAKIFQPKQIYRFAKPREMLRNAFLVITLISLVSGSLFVVFLLDPYSNFGRMMSAFAKPVAIGANNMVASLADKAKWYGIYSYPMPHWSWVAVAFPAGFFVLVSFMSFFGGRLYCNTVCPVGTLLGWFSRFSFWKIRFDTNRCTTCAKCARVCKSQCIDLKSKTIDFSRCVACYNCTGVCYEGAIGYGFSPLKMPKRKPVAENPDRRKLFAITAAYVLAHWVKPEQMLAGPDVHNKVPTTIPNDKTTVVVPPGARGSDHFLAACTACHLCVSACPAGVIRPAFLEHRFTGMMQPFMDFTVSYCTFECNRCTSVCPTGALLPVTMDEKKTLQIGKVHFIHDNCVVVTDNTACGSCSEHCPTQAVHMVPYKGNLTIPETDQTICIGCGACEHACPTRPFRAIYVDGCATHGVADKPKTKKVEQTVEEEFPF